jgi:hypothetical protein
MLYTNNYSIKFDINSKYGGGLDLILKYLFKY